MCQGVLWTKLGNSLLSNVNFLLHETTIQAGKIHQEADHTQAAEAGGGNDGGC